MSTELKKKNRALKKIETILNKFGDKPRMQIVGSILVYELHKQFYPHAVGKFERFSENVKKQLFALAVMK